MGWSRSSCRKAACWAPRRWCRSASVARFGPDAVMIDTAGSVIPADDEPRVREILDRKGTLLGTRVVTEEGDDLGRIGDLYFDETTGRITAYEVSGGKVGDLMRGTSYLPFDEIKTIGTDAVIASGTAREVVDQEQAGAAPAMPKAQSPSPEYGDPGSDGSLVGVRATSELTDRDGSIVVARGQAITADMVERARTNGTLDGLYEAAGQTPPGTEGDPAGEALSKAADTAADLWGRFTTKMSEMTDAAGQRVDAQQTKARLDAINDAIGRPVTKVFLDRDDSVILDLGDLVTHQAVQRADDAGLLDSLLGSVYKAPDVTFTRDEMRAEIAGDSTVDKASGGASIVDDLTAKVDEAAAKDEPGPEDGRSRTTSKPVGDDADGKRTTDSLVPEQPARNPGQTVGQRSKGNRVPAARD